MSLIGRYKRHIIEIDTKWSESVNDSAEHLRVRKAVRRDYYFWIIVY